MQTVSTPYKKGPSGQAKVVFNKRNVVVTMKDGGQQMTFDLDAIQCPIPAKPLNGDYNVAVSYDLSKLYNVAPWSATALCKFKQFASPKDQPPIPKYPSDRVGRTKAGVTYDKNYLQFVAQLEIEEPSHFQGMVIPGVFRYNFAADTNGNTGITNLRSKYTELLMSFLDRASGDVATLNLPFSDNILPALQRELQNRDRSFQVVIERGFAAAFSEPMLVAKRKPAAKKATTKKK